MDQLLHVAAWTLLRTCSLATTHRLLRGVGRILPALRTGDDLRKAAVRLGTRGSCLSRTLALAARAPGADVVIGVQRADEAGLRAHAWIEFAGSPLFPSDPQGLEIARLCRHLNPRHPRGTEA